MSLVGSRSSPPSSWAVWSVSRTLVCESGAFPLGLPCGTLVAAPGRGGARWGGCSIAHRCLSALKPSLLLRRWRGIGPLVGRAWDPWPIATMTCVRPWVSGGGRARFGLAGCWAFGGVLGGSWSTSTSRDYVCGPGLFSPGALHSLTICPMRSLLLSDVLVSLVRMHPRVVSRTYTLICTVSVVYMHLLYIDI